MRILCFPCNFFKLESDLPFDRSLSKCLFFRSSNIQNFLDKCLCEFQNKFARCTIGGDLFLVENVSKKFVDVLVSEKLIGLKNLL